jgi:hypothetical protein
MRPDRTAPSIPFLTVLVMLTACSGGQPSNVVPETASAQGARAATITCTMRNLNGPDGKNVWPYSTNVVGCTGTSFATLGNVQAALQQVVDKYFIDGSKLQKLAPPVWIFHTVADYKTVWQGAANVPLPSNDFGVTYVENIRPGGPNNGKPYTLIFEQSNGLADVYVGHTAAHEMGHWIDRFIEGTVSNPYSAQDIWTIELSADWTHFNALRGPCTLPSQVFNGEQPSPALPTTPYICDNKGQGPALASEYSGLSNTGVLQKAWPMIFAAPLSHYDRDILAEETAVDAGLQWPNLDTYFTRNDWWTCTQTLLKSQLTYGAAPGHSPSPYTWPSGCPKR